jgi:hypothetical protein
VLSGRERSLRRADHSSRLVLSSKCDLETSTVRWPWSTKAVEPLKNTFRMNDSEVIYVSEI